MSLSKSLAAAYCAAVLLLQTYKVFATTAYNERHWPFMNYPMYSASFGPGDRIAEVKLMVRSCDGGRPEQFTDGDAHLIYFQFRKALMQAGNVLGDTPPSRSAAAVDLLRDRIRGYAGRPVCELSVWSRLYQIGPKGLEMPGMPWKEAGPWPMAPSGAPADTARAHP
jgi:hypothetical protein